MSNLEHPSFDSDNGHVNGASNGSVRGTELAQARLNRLAPQPVQARRESEDYEGGDGVNLQHIVTMLLRRWKVLLTTFLLVVGAGVTYTLLQKPVYQATTTVVVSTSASNDSGASELASSLVGGTSQSRSIGTQIAILNSVPVQTGAYKGLPASDRTSLRTFCKIEVRPQVNAEAIDIVVSARDKVAARDYADAICREYIQQSKQQNSEQVRIATQYVASQLGPVRDRVKQAATALRNYKERYGVIDFGEQSKARIAQLSQLETDLRQAQSDQASAQAQLADLRTQIQTMPESKQHIERTVRSPIAETLKAQLTQLELKRIATLRDYRPASREVTDIQKQMADIRAQLAQQAKTEAGSWVEEVNPVRQNLVQDIARLQGQSWAYEARAKAIESAAGGARSELAQLPEREYQLGQLSIDQETLRQTYQTLNEKYQALLISETQRMANARIISPAQLPLAPISPRKMLNYIMSVLLGLMLAITMAAIVDRLDDRVHSESEARIASGLSVLTQIPLIGRDEQSLIEGKTRSSLLLESYRMLRTNLSFAAIDEPIRSLLVTSSQPGEGKSTSAINIATVMAMDGKNVILVDCDLRRPTLHRRLNLNNAIGFTSVLSGANTLEEALQPTSTPGLRVLTSGPLPPNPTELLNSRTARAQLLQIFHAADLVVVDSPPALVIADAQILASLADAAVLVISFKEAGRREIMRTSEILAQTGARILGSVLNKMPTGLGGAYSSYNYQYYSSYLSPDDNSEHSNAAFGPESAIAADADELPDNASSETREPKSLMK